jgi:hypothetical protein
MGGHGTSRDPGMNAAARDRGPLSPDRPAILVGSVSILANGCPMRQHVLAAQGDGGAMMYLGGYFSGALIFHLVVSPMLGTLLL